MFQEPKTSVKRDGSLIKSNLLCYRIRECYSTTATVFNKEYIPYSGKVYDLTLDRNHIMYVRRNGKCFWGSNCMCYTIPILKTEDEFFDDDEDVKSVNEVEDVPQGFADWVEKNAGRIEAAEKRGTVPYFIADNRATVKRILEGKKRVEEAESTTQTDTIETSAKRVKEVANIIIKNGYHSSREAQMPPLNIGSVSSSITDYAEKNQIDLDSHDIYVTTKSIEHTFRESKVSKGIAVTVDELVDFVKNRNNYAIYYDPAMGDFIFATSKAKFIVRPNYKLKINKEKKSVFNYISATRIIGNLSDNVGGYIKIKDAKQ